MASSDSAGSLSGGEPSITVVERRGIEHVPQSERWGKPSGLFWMWAGAVWNVEFVYYGAIAVVFLGLSFAQAVLIILVGNLSYVLTGLASLQGPRAGTTTFAISRAPFGPRGNKLPSFFNWVTQVGFEIEGIAFIVFAAIVLTSKAGFTAGTAAKVIFIIAGRRDPGRAADPGARGGADGAALADDSVRGVVRGARDPDGRQGEPARRGPRRELGRAVCLPGSGHLRRRTGLDGERQRLLPVLAGEHGQEADRGRRRTWRGRTLGAARNSRCCCRHRGPGRGRLADRAGGRASRPDSWCRS